MKQTEKRYTIRKHLSKGKNFGFWQIRGYITDSKQGAEIEYVNPATHSIELVNCLLYNKINAAKKIFEGGEKNPCAYIIFQEYKVIERQNEMGAVEVSFNPKKCPNWLVGGVVSDFTEIPQIVSSLTKLFVNT